MQWTAPATGIAMCQPISDIADGKVPLKRLRDRAIRWDADLAENRRMYFRIGVNLGGVMVKGGDLLGEGVSSMIARNFSSDSLRPKSLGIMPAGNPWAISASGVTIERRR